MSVGDAAGGPHADMSEGAGAVAQAAPEAEPDGGAPDATAPEGDVPLGPVAGPPGPQPATAPTIRKRAHAPAMDRIRCMVTA